MVSGVTLMEHLFLKLMLTHALLKSLARIAHTRWGRNIRQLLLVDNMAVALAFDRGRPRNYKMLRIIRKFGAFCLARSISPSVRWIPSEYNSADEPSRNHNSLIKARSS